MEYMPDWSGFVPDLLVEIAIRVQFVEDFMAFRGVCTSWRAAAGKDKFRPATVRVPLLMLAEKEGSDEREFYSLSKKKICMKLPLPEAKGKKCIEARFGWFVTLTSSGEVTLLNPFSRAKMELPNFKTFPEYEEIECIPEFSFVRRAVLSENPSSSNSFVLLVVVSSYMGFWRPGDENWTRIEYQKGAFTNITCHNRKFYATNGLGNIYFWDPDSDSDLTVAHPLLDVDNRLVRADLPYLVESSDGRELLLITRNDIYGLEDDGSYGATDFRVIRIDVAKRESKLCHLSNGDAIFIGENAAVSVLASAFPDVIMPNCIYFTDDVLDVYYEPDGGKGGGKDMGIYHLEDKRIERLDVESFSLVCPPLWIAPSA